jgi:hypothetical protein
MRLHFLPYVREGFRPSRDASAWRAQAKVVTRLSLGTRVQARPETTFELLGPGDVIGIDTSEVLRMLPARNSQRAEPDFFPALELDSPDLPWAYSPRVPRASRLMPWICLIVVEEQAGVRIAPGGRGQSAQVLTLDASIARRELPDLGDGWAWAHAQVICESEDDIRETLEHEPDRTLARLLCPRRLEAHRRYIACVVPTYLAGRIAGLGGDPELDAASIGLKPAWSSSDVPSELPVYLSWRFATAEQGDVESMVKALRPPGDGPRAPRMMRVQVSGAADSVLEFQPPLRSASTGELPAAAPQVVAALRAALEPAPGELPVFGPPYHGGSYVPEKLLDGQGWAQTLNLHPMWRAAAGMGAEIVRREQEQLVAVLDAQFREQRELARRQNANLLATMVQGRFQERLRQAPDTEASRVLGPVVTRAEPEAESVGLLSVAGRRATARAWRRPPPSAQVRGVANNAAVASASGLGAFGALRALTKSAAPAAAAVSSLPVGTGPVVQPPPLVDKLQHLAWHAPDAAHDRFEPYLGAPFAELFARHYRDLFVPAAGELAEDTIVALDVDTAFVEALLIGASEELNRELLFRGYPVGRGALPFRSFFQRLDQSDDLPDSRQLSPARALGRNMRPTGGGILLRSELVARCPGLTIGALPAHWEHGSRKISRNAALALPAVRMRLADDLLFVAFAELPLETLLGGPTPNQSAGWFFVFAENPTDPRFGLDPVEGADPNITRGSLSWAHLRNYTQSVHAPPASFPAVPDADFTYASSNAASFAYVTQQRPFRAYLHARVLAR